MLKKLLIVPLIIGSVLLAPAIEEKAAPADRENAAWAGAAAQDRSYRKPRQRWNRRGARVITRVRIVRRGFRTYREVWQYRYLPNGRVETRLLSRVRLR